MTPARQIHLTTLAAIISRLSDLHFEFVADKEDFQAIDYLFERRIQRFQCYPIFTKYFKKRKRDSGIFRETGKFKLDKNILYRLIERFYLKQFPSRNYDVYPENAPKNFAWKYV